MFLILVKLVWYSACAILPEPILVLLITGRQHQQHGFLCSGIRTSPSTKCCRITPNGERMGYDRGRDVSLYRKSIEGR